MRQQGLLDTDIVIDYDKGWARDWLEGQIESGWRFFISSFTVMETFKCYARSGRPKDLLGFQERLFLFLNKRRIKIVYPNRSVCDKAWCLLIEMCLQKTPTKREGIIYDMLIAATAIDHSLVLFTRNLKDFEWIASLYSLYVEGPDYSLIHGGGS